METMRRIILVLSLVCLFGAGPASATVFFIELIDTDDQLTIRGEVDSATNKLTVTSWENIGPIAFWNPDPGVPSNLPISYTALDSVGVNFDVPDNWDGTISSDWGFVADLPNTAIAWVEGAYVEVIRHHGWGAGVQAVGGLDVSQNEFVWHWTPTGSDTFDDITFETVNVTVIPEPSVGVLLFSGLVAALVLVPGRRD
jgi:hypothetical protein